MARRSAPRQPPVPREAPGLRLVLSPHGRVHLEPDPEPGHGLPPRTARELTQAFARGPAHGLLHLGAARMPADLPPSLAFWRRLGHLLVARFCTSTTSGASTDRDAGRQPLEVPHAELAELVRTPPELVGVEYLSTGLLADLWTQLEAALVAEGTPAGSRRSWPA